jgi:hypothetical protein
VLTNLLVGLFEYMVYCGIGSDVILFGVAFCVSNSKSAMPPSMFTTGDCIIVDVS